MYRNKYLNRLLREVNRAVRVLSTSRSSAHLASRPLDSWSTSCRISLGCCDTLQDYIPITMDPHSLKRTYAEESQSPSPSVSEEGDDDPTYGETSTATTSAIPTPSYHQQYADHLPAGQLAKKLKTSSTGRAQAGEAKQEVERRRDQFLVSLSW